MKRTLSGVCFFLMVLVGQPAPAHAWFFDFGWWGHRRPERYREIIVGGTPYYYHAGVFYTGAPGSYVSVEAPVGAVINETPPDSERVMIDGQVYFVSHGIYYQHIGGGWRVIHHRGWRRRHEYQDSDGHEQEHYGHGHHGD
ncbi:MAG: hypothetical protein KGJ09_01405 [Candidatus Omnitrophica bacterium]|nr:hypothetical protein [Candidatus Omnitrophota bacterium]